MFVLTRCRLVRIYPSGGAHCRCSPWAERGVVRAVPRRGRAQRRSRRSRHRAVGRARRRSAARNVAIAERSRCPRRVRRCSRRAHRCPRRARRCFRRALETQEFRRTCPVVAACRPAPSTFLLSFQLAARAREGVRDAASGRDELRGEWRGEGTGREGWATRGGTGTRGRRRAGSGGGLRGGGAGGSGRRVARDDAVDVGRGIRRPVHVALVDAERHDAVQRGPGSERRHLGVALRGSRDGADEPATSRMRSQRSLSGSPSWGMPPSRSALSNSNW